MQYANIVPQGLETEHFHKRIHCRSGHITVQYKHHILVWGGSREVHYDSGTRHEYHDTGEVMMFNCFTEVWTRLITSGSIPLKSSGAAGVILNNNLYVFGGFQLVYDDGNGQVVENSGNTLHKLDLRTLEWTEMHPSGICPSPCDKLVGWTYGEKLYFFGGFGPAPAQPNNVPFMYIDWSSGDFTRRGWINQFLCYDPAEDNWSWPSTKGHTPMPRAAHAADIQNGKVYIFGGRLLDERVNTLHCLDMETMKWSENLTNLAEETPEGRSWHSFSFISDNVAIVYGGFSQHSMILNDVWLYHTNTNKWTKSSDEKNEKNKPRLWHKTVYFSAPGRHGELHIVGGYQSSIFDKAELADSLLTLNFEPKSLLRLSIKACLTHFQETSSGWRCLPKTLEQTLRQRLEQI